MFNIESRRYIGSKTKLIDQIKENVKKGESFVDIFGGTGVVSDKLLKSRKVIINDLLFSNYICYDAFFGKEKVDKIKIIKFIKKLNNLKPKYDNYFSINFGGNYFDKNVAKKIGVIREWIEKKIKETNIKNILISSLLYSMDGYANTVGHYEMFLKNHISSMKKNFVMKPINMSNRGNDIEYYNEDANILIDKIKGDVLYLDPPYNARQYINFYHIWENLAKWEKPKLKWESKKFDRKNLKSKYSTSKAKEEFLDLIEKAKKNFKKIIVSYNNTYNANSNASNNKISYDDIVNILSEFGKVKVLEIPHKNFNAGKTYFKNHKEYIFVTINNN